MKLLLGFFYDLRTMNQYIYLIFVFFCVIFDQISSMMETGETSQSYICLYACTFTDGRHPMVTLQRNF